jgi:hypothetical protein
MPVPAGGEYLYSMVLQRRLVPAGGEYLYSMVLQRRLVPAGGEYLYSFHFPKSVAGLGSMLSDVQVCATLRVWARMCVRV